MLIQTKKNDKNNLIEPKNKLDMLHIESQYLNYFR